MVEATEEDTAGVTVVEEVVKVTAVVMAAARVEAMAENTEVEEVVKGMVATREAIPDVAMEWKVKMKTES